MIPAESNIAAMVLVCHFQSVLTLNVAVLCDGQTFHYQFVMEGLPTMRTEQPGATPRAL